MTLQNVINYISTLFPIIYYYSQVIHSLNYEILHCVDPVDREERSSKFRVVTPDMPSNYVVSLHSELSEFRNIIVWSR